MLEPVLLQREGSVVILTLNNPDKLNAFSQAMRDSLTAHLGVLNSDPECRAIILTGSGENFSAGADLTGFNETTVQQCRTRLKTGGAHLMREIVAGAKPIIAAVEGYAFGAGLALASAADYVVASDTAKFCCAFTRVGFIPDMALLYTLPHRVGQARAKQFIALANTMDAVQATAWGLVDEMTAKGAALAAARLIALRYCEAPPLAFELMKSTFARGLESMLQAEIDLQPMLWLSEDHKEGKLAFFEKRRPKFTGR